MDQAEQERQKRISEWKLQNERSQLFVSNNKPTVTKSELEVSYNRVTNNVKAIRKCLAELNLPHLENNLKIALQEEEQKLAGIIRVSKENGYDPSEFGNLN